MAPRASRPTRRDRNLSPGPSTPPTGLSLLSRCRALYFPTRPGLSPWTTLERPYHHLLRGLRSWVPPCPLWSPVVSVLTQLCKGAVPLPPHPRIGESGLLVSLSLDKPGTLSSRLLGTEIPELQPPRPPQPRPPHQLRLRRAPFCAPAQQFLPTGQVAGEEGGETGCSVPLPSSPEVEDGGTTGPTALEGGGSDQLAPPAAAGSGHPGPTGPTLGKPSMTTPQLCLQRPQSCPRGARRLGHLCKSASLMPRP